MSETGQQDEADYMVHLDSKDRCSNISTFIRWHFEDIEQACRTFDTHNSGKILRSQMKKVLRTYCCPITNEEFQTLVPKYHTDFKGKVYYRKLLRDLSKRCETTEIRKASGSLSKCITINHMESLLKKKIESNLRNIIKGFYLYDVANDGFIQKKELRKVLENYCFKLSDEQFNQLWKRYDPPKTGLVCYQDFLVKLGINVEKCRKYLTNEIVISTQCWSDKGVVEGERKMRLKKSQDEAIKNFQDDPCTKGISLNIIWILFIKKLKKRGMDTLLSNACQMHDIKNTGHITLMQFHGIINHFVMPISYNLFKQLIDLCDSEKKSTSKICWKSFIDYYCNNVVTQCPLFESRENQLVVRGATVMEKIKLNVPNPKDRIARAITFLDKHGIRTICRSELKKVIESPNFRLSEEEIKDLFFLLDPEQTNTINVDDVLALFEYPIVKPFRAIPPGSFRKALSRKQVPSYRKHTPPRCCQIKPSGDGFNPKKNRSRKLSSDSSKEDLSPASKKYPELSGIDLKSMIKKFFNRNLTNIMKSLNAADYHSTGRVHINVLRCILQTYVFPMTDEQWSEVLEDFYIVKNEIFYKSFLKLYYRNAGESSSKWNQDVCNLLQLSKQLRGSTSEEIQEQLREGVRSKRNALLTDMLTIDSTSTGVLDNKDFRQLLEKHVFRLNDKQFQNLWDTLPKDDVDRLRYPEFLKQFSCLEEQRC